MLGAGGKANECYLAICDGATDQELIILKNTAFEDPTFAQQLLRQYVNASTINGVSYIGKSLYIKIVDVDGTGFNFIEVDDIRVSMTDDEVRKLEYDQYTSIMTETRCSADNKYIGDLANVRKYYETYSYPFTPYRVINGGFETGDLYGWTHSFGNRNPIINTNTYGVGDGIDMPYNNKGYHLSGWEVNTGIPESGTWEVQSSTFTLGGSGYISVRMGGNAAVVRVFDASNNLEIGCYRQNRFKDEHFPYIHEGGSWCDMATYVIQLDNQYIGKSLYIKLCDETPASGGWTNAFFDEVVTYYETAPDWENLYETVKDGYKSGETPTDVQIRWQLAGNPLAGLSSLRLLSSASPFRVGALQANNSAFQNRLLTAIATSVFGSSGPMEKPDSADEEQPAAPEAESPVEAEETGDSEQDGVTDETPLEDSADAEPPAAPEAESPDEAEETGNSEQDSVTVETPLENSADEEQPAVSEADNPVEAEETGDAEQDAASEAARPEGGFDTEPPTEPETERPAATEVPASTSSHSSPANVTPIIRIAPIQTLADYISEHYQAVAAIYTYQPDGMDEPISEEVIIPIAEMRITKVVYTDLNGAETVTEMTSDDPYTIDGAGTYEVFYTVSYKDVSAEASFTITVDAPEEIPASDDEDDAQTVGNEEATDDIAAPVEEVPGADEDVTEISDVGEETSDTSPAITPDDTDETAEQAALPAEEPLTVPMTTDSEPAAPADEDDGPDSDGEENEDGEDTPDPDLSEDPETEEVAVTEEESDQETTAEGQ